MTSNEITRISDNWITLRSNNAYSDSELDFDLPFNKPDMCIDVILNILEKIDIVPENKLFDILAAGPLEDLLQENGHLIIDRVEILARTNPAFRKLLNGVWGNELNNSIKKRLDKYMINRW